MCLSLISGWALDVLGFVWRYWFVRCAEVECIWYPLYVVFWFGIQCAVMMFCRVEMGPSMKITLHLFFFVVCGVMTTVDENKK